MRESEKRRECEGRCGRRRIKAWSKSKKRKNRSTGFVKITERRGNLREGTNSRLFSVGKSSQGTREQTAEGEDEKDGWRKEKGGKKNRGENREGVQARNRGGEGSSGRAEGNEVDLKV